MRSVSPNPSRFDPYKNFKLRVRRDGQYVAVISTVSALTRSAAPIEHREGGDHGMVPSRRARRIMNRPCSSAVPRSTPNSSSGRTRCNIGSGLGADVSLKDFRKEIVIEAYNEPSQLATCVGGRAAPVRAARADALLAGTSRDRSDV